MSADNGVFLNADTFEVIIYQSGNVVKVYKCKTFYSALKKAEKLDQDSEYGIKFVRNND
jgi:hypothetical protein